MKSPVLSVKVAIQTRFIKEAHGKHTISCILIESPVVGEGHNIHQTQENILTPLFDASLFGQKLFLDSAPVAYRSEARGIKSHSYSFPMMLK